MTLRIQQWRQHSAFLLALSVPHGSSHAQLMAAPQAASSAPAPTIQRAASADILHMLVGHSLLLTTPVPLRRIYVGSPALLHSYTSGQREVVITAKSAGVSSLVLWDIAGGHRLYTISADIDPELLQASLREALPGSQIQASASGAKLFLTGTVPTDAASEAAYKLASLYTKNIVNSLTVRPVHSRQVQLKLRIVEVDRTRLEQMGINFLSGGKNTSSVSTQQFGATTQIGNSPTGGFNATTPLLNLLFFNSGLNVGVNVQDLEQKQILQILAEPTLTTLSGLPARFLSGGEFPFPVVQGGTGNSTAITIVFRPYGVKVDFTPTVNADGSIRLKVSPEVSALDFTNAVTISGFTVPALSTRRAETEVEIKDGQSFVVSGLLDHRVTDSLSKIPGISDIPILGQIFRSKSLQHSVIELVILVTASVVDPLTNPEIPVEPKLAVPNLDASTFDIRVHKELGKELGAGENPDTDPQQEEAAPQ